MGLDRGLADDQLRRDLGVREPARDELEDLDLARRQLVEAARRRGRRGGPGELVDQAARDRGSEQGVAARDDPDARGELLRRDVFQQDPLAPARSAS